MEAEAAAGGITKFLVDSVTGFFGPVMSCGDNMELLKQEVEELQSTMDDVKQKIEDADREGKKPTSSIGLWQQKVEKLQGEARKMDASFSKMCKCVGDFSPNVLLSYSLSRRAEKMIKQAKTIKTSIPPIATKAAPLRFVGRPSGSMVGRDEEFEQLHQLSLDDTVSIISIYGMGGVGKTKLLDEFYNKSSLRDTHHMIRIDMNDCRGVFDAQKVIAEELELHWDENEKQEARARRLLDYLNKKKFVMIFDNVWQAMELDDIGIPTAFGEERSKIILATRIEHVCDSMDAKKIHVNCLEEEEAWDLFEAKAGENLIKSHSRIKRHAEELVDKCGGLPLALITLGRAMASKKTGELWRHAVTQLEIAPQKIIGMEEKVLSRLKHSYDNLADNKLRECLLYFVLFTEGFWVDKESIIDYYIGEGIIDDRNFDGVEIYTEGHKLIDDLKSVSLLEEDENGLVRIHPMMRIVALWIACECGKGEQKWLAQPDHNLNVAPEVEKWRGAERVSLAWNSITTLPEIPDCPSLITLFMMGNPELEKICDGFFSSMRNLRVLDLSETSIEEVPAEIGKLVQLQFLNFSNTSITSLPQELGNLVKLRFLLLSFTRNLTDIPDELIAKLSQLRVLKMYASYGDWSVDSVDDTVDFQELIRLKLLKVLGITISTVAALEGLAASHHLASCTQELQIKLAPNLTEVSTATLHNDYKSLKWLQLSKCSDLEVLEISSGDEDPLLPNLTDIYLIELPKAKIIWKNGFLESLSCLEINGCTEMKYLIYSGDESLNEEDEEGEKEEQEEEEEEEEEDDDDEDEGGDAEIDVLPKLKELTLTSLPNLESLSCGRRQLAFPSLEILYVDDCPKLKRLPTNAEKLSRISGEASWWNDLEWPEGEDIKSKFESIFEEIYT